MYRPVMLDDAVEFFDPESGRRIRVRSPWTEGMRQRAPRSVQFALSNHCNLTCGFCSRPTDRQSTWTVESAVEVLADLDRLGVAEVAFGGGEPLVFAGIFELVDRLRSETALAVHMTTNGVLLSDEALDRLADKVGEFRVSLYDDNDWRATVARLRRRGVRFGVNRLVTPVSVERLAFELDELLSLGCSDALLLPVLGHPDLATGRESIERLSLILETYRQRMTLKLGVCWGEELDHHHRLFPSSDCGAGREFIEITSDRHVRPCSFHAEAVPFESAADVIALWRSDGQSFRALAGCSGCPRGSRGRNLGIAPASGVFLYSGFASNNSGSYTLLGSFESAGRAAEVAAILNQLAEDMETLKPPDNPLAELLRRAGIDAAVDLGRSDDWPAKWGSPPEAVQIDHQVWWHVAYTVTMPHEIGHWFYTMGGRVNVELDHAHHPLIAEVSLWPDLPWSERATVDIDALVGQLLTGVLSGDEVKALIRKGTFESIEVLWLGPDPTTMSALMREAAALSLRARLKLTEALEEEPDLRRLWGETRSEGDL